jgi:hypothetical protein
MSPTRSCKVMPCQIQVAYFCHTAQIRPLRSSESSIRYVLNHLTTLISLYRMKRAPEKKLIIDSNGNRDNVKTLWRWPNISCMDLSISVTRNKLHDETNVLKCLPTNLLEARRKHVLLIKIARFSRIPRTIRNSDDFKSIDNTMGQWEHKNKFSV